MTEQQLQSKTVIWFSQTFPHLRGCLFEINNDGYSLKHSMTRRAMGRVPGVADLIFLQPATAKICALEIKAPGSTHKKEHIQRQIEWLQLVQDNGGFAIMSSDENEIKEFICACANGTVKNKEIILKTKF